MPFLNWFSWETGLIGQLRACLEVVNRYYWKIRLFISMLCNMYWLFILLSILTCTSHGFQVRKSYQDETSWSFQHPTARYKKLSINPFLVQTLSTIPMDASSSVRYIWFYNGSFYIDTYYWDSIKLLTRLLFYYQCN